MSTYGNYSENDCLEAMAGSLAGSIAPNGRRISQLSGAVKVATILVLLAGPVGLLVVKLA